MNNFNERLFGFLSNNQGFYMQQYFSKFHKEERWIAIKDLEDGIYAVIISKESEEDIDFKEGYEYLSTLEKRFLLNSVVITNGEYIKGTDNYKSKLVYNNKLDKVIYCDEPCKPLMECLRIIYEEKSSSNIYYNIKNIIKESPVTSTLIIINIIIFIITAIMSRSIMDINTMVLIECGAKVNYLINKGQIWRLLTCAFLHGGLIHIALNMYSLFIVGTVVEKIYGWKKYLGIYFLSSITSSLLGYLLGPEMISIGASGAIFGVLGAFLWFAIKEKENLQKGVLGNIIAVIVLNLFIGLTSSNIDNLGHIGGFIGGFTLSVMLYKKR
ncbi:rhomboid protease GluP [Clostridium moniliforme]|uniref:Rhomboid protease GluP n=1 Tax=Clostridium moniliforme TaxID=39489 RepID=A0ABS4EZP2_9CLOT|nr:rhomboid family intramembrane serine protease [Clostridium moniliforme]MBP1889461.1 rhomboid protease GluP [Clostridium moniliforme]